MHIRLLLRYVFGVRICLDCPACVFEDTGEDFCIDAEGLSCEIEGGSIGRMLTVVGTSEFQKKRDEHLHMQGIVECMHTSTSLHDIADTIVRGYTDLVTRYKAYADHVCKQGYASAGVDVAERRVAATAT